MTRDHKRFAQLVRKKVREHVKAEREAPAFSLWVSDGADPRACARLHVGAAVDANHVRTQCVEAIEAAGAYYAAIGRLIHDTSGEEPVQTNIFGLIAFARGAAPAGWAVDIVAGRIGSWFEWTVDSRGFEFAQAALDRVAKREEKTMERIVTCPRCEATVNVPADSPLPEGGPRCAMGHEEVAMIVSGPRRRRHG